MGFSPGDFSDLDGIDCYWEAGEHFVSLYEGTRMTPVKRLTYEQAAECLAQLRTAILAVKPDAVLVPP